MDRPKLQALARSKQTGPGQYGLINGSAIRCMQLVVAPFAVEQFPQYQESMTWCPSEETSWAGVYLPQ